MELKDKVALVTGAAQGIGKAIAKAFAKEGANIIVSDIDLELATQTANEIKEAGVKTIPLKMNVADLAEVEAGVKKSVEELGKIDILVNNAGITKDNLFLRMKKEDWDAVISVNLTGVFNLCKTISRLMMRERCGKIINIASVVGETGNVGQANYSASKAGIMGFTKTVAREVASRGITINAVAPGFIQTEMTEALPQKTIDAYLQQIPLGRLGTTEDVAETVYWLCSDSASYITGQIIHVNGGLYM